MNKPNNYDNVQASGDFTPIELGGHILVIKQVEEMTSKTGRPMIKISFDTANTDKQPRYFADLFKNDIRPEKKWPNNGTTYILTEDKDGNCSKQLKTFTTSVERSNAGFTVVWGDKFASCFKDKFIGGVFGKVQEEYNGEVNMKNKLRWFRSVEDIQSVEIPEDKLLPQGTNITPRPDSDGFISIPDSIDEELPFN